VCWRSQKRLTILTQSFSLLCHHHVTQMRKTLLSYGKLYYVAREASFDAKALSQSRSRLRGCGIVFITTEWNICSKRCTRTRSVGVECRNEPEEISDVSLGTFYAFDSENVQTDRPARRRFAVGCGGCGCGYGP
jgi:hypothetical protein